MEQAAGEVPKAIGQDVADAGNVLSSITQPAQIAPYAFQQAVTQGAPAVNTPTLDAAANIGRQQVAEAQQEQQQARGNLLPAPDDNTSTLGKVGYYAQEAAVGAPTLLGALGAGPVGGAALFGLQSAGGAYAQKRDVENEDPETAASSAATEGAISALAGSIPLHAALNPESVNALKTVATTAGGGVAQSLLTEAGNMLSEQQNEGKTITYDEAVSRLKSAAAGGVIPGLILGAAGAASHAGVSPADRAAARVGDLANQIIGATPEESGALNTGAAMADSIAANTPESRQAKEAANNVAVDQ